MQKTCEYIILHHTATNRDTTTLRAVNEDHRKKWNLKSSRGYYCGYGYFIDGSGVITKTRSDRDVGVHCPQENMNYRSIGIALTGNFETQQLSDKQVESLKALLYVLRGIYKIPLKNILGHNEVKGTKTACPGLNFLKFIEKYKQV